MNMNNRREFLKTASLALAATTIPGRVIQFSDSYPVAHLGLQLWSVRDAMEKDAAGTIRALGRMGYREVEGFGYNEGKMFGMPLKDYRKVLSDNGISTPSCHVGISVQDWAGGPNTVSDRFKKIIDDMASIGLKYVVVPWIGEEERRQVKNLVGMLNAAGEYSRKAGIRLGYHNHDFEYTQKGPDGRRLIEWILHETDPKLVAMEMDMYWVTYAGFNPMDWFRLYPGRWELCHVKDMAKTPERETIEVGDGSIDFSAIFKLSAQAGLKYYIIELENYRTNSIDGVDRARKGFLNIR